MGLIQESKQFGPRYYPIGSLDIEGRDVVLVINSREYIGRARFS